MKRPEDLEAELDKWLYAIKHLTEFEKRPSYLSGREFDELFNLARYANLTREEKNMYDASLKRKWDNKNVMDYAVETADKKAREEERAKAEAEKKEMTLQTARNFKNMGLAIEDIAKGTGLTIQEIESL